MATKNVSTSNSNKGKASSTSKKAITISKDAKGNKPVKSSIASNPKKKLVSGVNKPGTLVKGEKPKKKKKKTGKIINAILSILMFLGICVMVLVMAFCVYIVVSAPPFEADKLYSQEASIFLDKEGEEFARVGTEKRETKTYEELPQTFVDALVATEDSRFFQHNGFDVIRFVKASLGQLAGNSGAGGASTLTMQVAKNTFSKNEDGTVEAHGIKGIVRKFTDIYMAIFLIERNYTKEEIIEFYANSQELGSNSFGVEQASQTYFGKSVSDLSLTESAILVGLFNGPSIYNPYIYPENTEYRRAVVLDLMVRHGYITEEQADDAKAIPVESLLTEYTIDETNPYQQYLDVAIDEVIEKTGKNPYTTSMIVYTNLDRTVQQYMTDLNEGKLGYKWKTYSYNDYKDVIQVGMVVTDVHDGSIIAVNGGRNKKGQRNQSLATSYFQPGSTAKPIFAYGPYLEYNNGNTGTLFFDNPMTYSTGQSLKNSDGSYMGAITMRQALAHSQNIPAVQAFQAVNKNKISEFVHGLGIDYCSYGNGRNNAPTDCNLYEAAAIGGGYEVSPKDMAAAYGAFARGGYYIEAYTISKIVYRETDEQVEFKYDKVQAMSEETAYMMTDMLMTTKQTWAGNVIHASGTDIALKTGTATYDSSVLKTYNIPNTASSANWVITYSPDYVISCWYGVEKADYKVYTDSVAAAVQKKQVVAAIANRVFKKNSKFTKPHGVVASKYEVETFPPALPSEYTPSNLISTELFKKGTEPSAVSERFSQLRNPTNGSAEVTGNQISLSWSEISTPNAISQTYLQRFFKENYGQFADMYLNKRISYNDANIGTLGYRVYLQTESGALQNIGYTVNPYFTYNAPSSGTYNFVIKSAYSIFDANMSSGHTITVSVGDGSGDNEIDIPTPDDNDENKDNNDNDNENEENNENGDLQ